MTWGVDTVAATFQILFMLDPVIGVRHRRIRYAKHPALHFHAIPQELVRAMHPNWRTGFTVNYTCCKDVVQVCVGVDETDATKGFISIDSPVARALLGKTVGDSTEVELPECLTRIEVISIRYL